MEFGKKQITLFKAISLAMIVTCFFTIFMNWLGASMMGMHAGANMFGTSFKGWTNGTSFWSVMLIINAILLILLAGLAIFGLLKDKNSLVLPFAVVGFISFFLAVFQKAFLGVGSDMHVGLGAWLMLFLSLLAFGFAALDNLAAGKPVLSLEDFGIHPGAFQINRGGMGGGIGGWTCPSCGARQGAAQRFCDRCGTQKPEPPRCPACGALAKPGELFCSNCGSRIS